MVDLIWMDERLVRQTMGQAAWGSDGSGVRPVELRSGGGLPVVLLSGVIGRALELRLALR